MDLSRPHAPITHRLDSAVLLVLAGTTRPLTGREVARLAPEGTQPGIWKALQRLVDQGLVRRAEAGSASLYSLNREHLAAPIAESLAGLRSELLQRLRDELRSWPIAPEHASLFGSAARRDGDTSSDIDVLVVRPAEVDEDDPAWRQQLDRLADRIYAWTGNRAALAEIATSRATELRIARPAIVDELEQDGVHLAGKQLDDTLIER